MNGSGSSGSGPLTRAVTDLCGMIEQERCRQASRHCLRSLVERTDVVVAACERAHLAGATAVTDDLAARADALWTEARSVFAGAAGWSALDTVNRLRSCQVIWIHQLMEALWSLQEEVFNELIPWRARLADNDETERWSERIPA